MADEPDNLILRMLRSLDEKMDTILDRLLDLTARMSSVEDQLAGVRTDLVRLEHAWITSTSGSNELNAGLT
jgi:hypothetical protein